MSCPSFARCGKQLLVKPGNRIQVVEPTRVWTTADGVLTDVLRGDVLLVAFTAIFLPTVFAVTAFLAADFVATAFFTATFSAEVFCLEASCYPHSPN